MKKILLSLYVLIAMALIADEKTIVRGMDRFELVYKLQLPRLEQEGMLWIPLAQTCVHQKFEALSISSPVLWHKTRDGVHKNELLVLRPSKAHSGQEIVVNYRVFRKEKSAYVEEGDSSKYLKADKLVPITARFAQIANKVAAKGGGDLAKGMAIYEHVLEHVRYDKSGKGWGRGDALYACDARTGNCTDFHAYFIALCRAIKIPARFAIGFTIPADRNKGNIGGYHCWAEFFADGKWVPVDISEADKHPELRGYYFGHHPANRLELSRGRDILPEPAPKAGSFNYFFGPHLELAGKVVPVKASFEFRRLPSK